MSQEDIPVIYGSASHQLLWNRTARTYPSNSSIPAQFQARTRERPNALALVDGTRRTTYADLDSHSDELAQRLRDEGVHKEDVVAVCMPRSDTLVLCELAVLKAGGAYLVLDPADSAARIRRQMTSAGATVVVTTLHRPIFRALRSTTVFVKDAWSSPASSPTGRALPQLDARQLAYVSLTSGSQGEPKAVMVEHRSVLRLLFGVEYVELGPDRVLLHAAAPQFDASTFEVWGALVRGGTCVVHRGRAADLQSLAAAIIGQAVDTLWLTSSLFNVVIDEQPHMLQGLRQLLIGGEVVSPRHVYLAQSMLPHTRIVNGYGPTETTTFACCHTLTQRVDPSRSVPIGRPISNTTAYVLRADGSLADVGEPGELFIGGDGVARGYRGHPELTARSFVSDPRAERRDGVMYASGDLARWLPEGLLEFLGRRDSQVKIRGHRAEPADIEVALRQVAGVRDAAVLAVHDRPMGPRLVAYVVVEKGRRVAADDVRSAVRDWLPDALIPATLIKVEALPLTLSGKLDRSALPHPGRERPSVSAEFEQPGTPTERLVIAEMVATLGIDSIGVMDDFFELGGDSLMAAALLARLSRGGIDLDARAIFDHPTARGLAALAAGGEPSRRNAPVPRRSGGGLESHRLSPAQQSILGAIVAHPESATAFTISTEVELREAIDPGVLDQAFRVVQNRQEALRTVMERGRSGWRARVLPSLSRPVPIDVVNLPDIWPASAPSAAPAASTDNGVHIPDPLPIGLDERPLFRASLFNRPDQRPVLRIDAHHVVFDGWSVGLLLSELARAESAITRPMTTPDGPPPFRYRDYVRWRQAWPTQTIVDEELTFWQQHLAGFRQVRFGPDLVYDPRSPRDGAMVVAMSPPGTAAALRHLAARSGTTLFVVMAAAYLAVLRAYSGREDLLISAPVSGRTRPEFDDVIGCFYNSVFLRTNLSGEPSFIQLLGRVRESTLAALAHQHTHISQVAAAIGIDGADRFKFALQDRGSLQLTRAMSPWIDADSIRVHSGAATTRDLHLQAWDLGGRLRLVMRYSQERFEPPTAARILGHYVDFLRLAAGSPGSRLEALTTGMALA
ncbi:amino acid adenylation domain-containing protein [Kribbella steppae]|uniref:Amino acid adenylation domain-containing protein n=1 Tax=Kribbella steppae TaxID=2512223 RepID=A0A4R2GZY6_9ACTN|nr:amino acid adenylation domain-containing protein [Kribbella steppae]TCO15703.1 amino acid adenylation domain-containing protein [Kribbella steppae]